MLKTWVFHFQSGVQSAEAFSHIHFSLFWVTKIAKGRESFPAFVLNYLEQNWLSGSYFDNSQFGALLSYNIRVPFSHSSIVILAVSEWILLPLAILCNICIALRSKIGRRYVAAHMRTPTDSLSRSLDNCFWLFVSFK